MERGPRFFQLGNGPISQQSCLASPLQVPNANGESAVRVRRW